MKNLIKLSCCLCLILVSMLSKAKAGLPGIINADTGIKTAIKQQLGRHHKLLYYPLLVARFYRAHGYKLAWVAPDTVKTHAGDAMILLDCVNQYGLNHANYHPGELTYTQLDLLTKYNRQTGNLQKAQFDIWLTDAVITFINNLHYGRYNPGHPAGKIDVDINDFNAALVLKIALSSPDFAKAITDVQPKSIAYSRLHRQLYLKTGLYAGDCYEFPEADIRLMAVNMERLRWYDARLKSRFELNIPSSTLIIHEPDRNYYLKVNADALIAFVKAHPDLRVARIDVKGDKINFLLSAALYKNAKELPVKSLDIGNNKISGRRSVVTSGRDKTIANLLKGQSKKDTQDLNISYITCAIKDGELIKYQDPLKADKALQNALYGEKP